MERDAALGSLIRGVAKVILVLASLAVVGWAVDALAVFPIRIPFVWRLLGFVPLVFGILLEMVATGRLWKSGGGTPNPIDPPRKLVTEGPYRRSRNPLYLARLLILSGLAVLLSSLGLALLIGALFLILQFVIVPREEGRLIVRYGDRYIAYRKTVSRWIALRPADRRRRKSPRT